MNVFLFETLRAFYFLFGQVRLWAPPSQISQGTYALDIAAKTLSKYEKFFKIPFPLPKQGRHCSCYYKKKLYHAERNYSTLEAHWV